MSGNRSDTTTLSVTRETMARIRELQKMLQAQQPFRVTTADTLAFSVNSASAIVAAGAAGPEASARKTGGNRDGAA